MIEHLTMKQRILIAAKEEFGTQGYQKASTNNIYPKANVSKGLIFKIFGSKANLFYELFKTGLEEMLQNMSEAELDKETDVIDKITNIAAWKIAYAGRHPLEMNIMLEAISNTPKELKTKIGAHIQDIMKLSLDQYFDEIDMSNINDKYTKADVKKYLTIASQGIQQAYLSKLLTMEDFETLKEEILELYYIIMRGMEK